MSRSTYILLSIILVLVIICTVTLTLLFTGLNSNSTSTETNMAVVSSATAKVSTEKNNKTSLEEIKEKQEAQKSTENKIKKSLANSVVENIKKNSQSEVDKATAVAEKQPIRSSANDTRSAQEVIDDISTNVAETGYGGFFSVLFGLQRVAVPASVVISAIAVIFAVIYHKDKRRFKFFILLAIGTPVFFLLIHVLPALYWYAQQKK